MTQFKTHFIAIIATAVLCGFWVMVQLMARKQGTKHSLNWPESQKIPTEKEENCISECTGTCETCQKPSNKE